MYNQPTTIGPDGKSIGVLYKNVLDCLAKTFKSEGISGLYKGPITLSLHRGSWYLPLYI